MESPLTAIVEISTAKEQRWTGNITIHPELWQVDETKAKKGTYFE